MQITAESASRLIYVMQGCFVNAYVWDTEKSVCYNYYKTELKYRQVIDASSRVNALSSPVNCGPNRENTAATTGRDER